MRVLAAMSGGVDSAVAAARAVDAGYEVTGVHLALSPSPDAERNGSRGCCTLEDARDARRAADVLDIPFYVWDMAERFSRDVVADFVGEYAAGRTPNPCIRCNEKIKFAAVLDRALALGFDALVTGHHARLHDGVLVRSVDPGKDQSYVLGTLTPAQLAHAIFPLGNSTKAEVRAEAARRGLAVADKPDSHDVCFVPSRDTAGWLRDRIGSQPGPVVDAATGDVVGRHDGAYAYTVGQRRGLQLGRPAADGQPRYVLSVEPVTRTVVVGSAEQLDITQVVAEARSWPDDLIGVGVRGTAQLRAHGNPVPATAVCTAAPDGPGRLQITLGEPVRGVAAGQTVVMYRPGPDGDRVVGGGTILAAHAGEQLPVPPAR
jgi:tRNA-specific 2-thiouridylase